MMVHLRKESELKVDMCAQSGSGWQPVQCVEPRRVHKFHADEMYVGQSLHQQCKRDVRINGMRYTHGGLALHNFDHPRSVLLSASDRGPKADDV